MIIFDNIYNNIKTDIQIPALFTGSGNVSFKDVFTRIKNDFLSSYTGFGTFASTGQRVPRIPQISKLTMEEFLFLRVNCGYENPVDALDSSINCNRIRAYKVNSEFDLGYSIQRFTYKSPINDKDAHCISVFIGNNFGDDKYNGEDATRLLYDLIEAYVDLQLCDYGVQLTHIISAESNINAIVMDHHVTPSDAMFATRYYECIFKTFIEAVDDLQFTKRFDLLYKADRPYLMPLKKTTIEKIYNYAHNYLEYTGDTESDFIDLCTDVYSELYEAMQCNSFAYPHFNTNLSDSKE